MAYADPADKASYDKAYYKRNKERMKARSYENQKKRGRTAQREIEKRYRRKLRFEVLDAYGGCCECCGEDNHEFLGIDHINGGGTQHRKETGAGHAFNQWLKRNGFPEGFRVLCHNCNLSYGFYGYCPHQDDNDVVLKAVS